MKTETRLVEKVLQKILTPLSTIGPVAPALKAAATQAAESVTALLAIVGNEKEAT